MTPENVARRLRGFPFKGDRVCWNGTPDMNGDDCFMVTLATVIHVRPDGHVVLREDHRAWSGEDPRPHWDVAEDSIRTGRLCFVGQWADALRAGYWILTDVRDHPMSTKAYGHRAHKPNTHGIP